ncbi:MAG: FAD-dependent oxidoreductase, partial [Proteobacteria bacterium]|nr:FAD-dependent oxidoreductase [Pseudomonadota bacterium]
MLRGRLCEEGVTIREEVEVASVARSGDGIAVTLAGSGKRIAGSHLLLAAGRKPRLDGLGLKEAGIECNRSGIKVNAHLRTTNPRVYAVGDITGGPQFTHIASYHAGIVIRNMLFHLPAKVDYRALPWVTYTDPELAQVGMKEEDARKRYGDDLRVVRASFGNNDRATAEGNTMGLIKIVTRKNGTILGASILGPHGGELIHVWALAISRNLNLKAFTNVVFPYPTLGEISKTAASAYYAPKLFSFWPRLLVRFLLRFG